MGKNSSQLIIVCLGLVLIFLFFYLNLGQFLTFDSLKSQQAVLKDFYVQSPISTILIFFGVYVLVTALSLPGAAILTLAGGVLFGTTLGTGVVSISSTVGATLAFLTSRFLFQEAVQNRFKKILKPINEGFKKEGAFYLFSLRLIPVFPFFVVNLVMGLLPIKVSSYFFISMIGMLPGTWVYVNAGTQLSQIQSPREILSFEVLLSFALLGIFPFFAKMALASIKRRKAYRNFSKPKKFDFNVLVIGAGSAGLVTSYIASTLRARVGLIEKHKMGGDCLNTGCVPSKALIKSAKIAHTLKKAQAFGIKSQQPEVDFAAVMNRIHEVIRKIEPHDSIERYTNLGVECIQGEAQILSPYQVRVGDKTLTTQTLVIATGASPIVPPIPGIEKITPLTSENLWHLKNKPKNMIVVGGGPIGCELAQAFARLGVHVTQIEQNNRLLPREDLDVAEEVMRSLKNDGVEIQVNTIAQAIEVDGQNQKRLLCKTDQETKHLAFDEILFAIGRRPNIKGFGLEALNLEINPSGTIAHDGYMSTTTYPNIFVCGDVAGPYQFTHMAAHQAYYASINALLTPFNRWIPFPFNKSLIANYKVVPWATFTDPEVATVGLTETQAKADGVAYELTKYELDDLDRAIADGEDFGFVKVLTAPGSDQILGATIVGSRASDMIAEFIAAMKHGRGLGSILGTTHIYPTHSEANKMTAGTWKRQRKPEAVLRKLNWFFRWRRNAN